MTSQKFLLRIQTMFPKWEWCRIRALLVEVIAHIDATEICVDAKKTPESNPVSSSDIYNAECKKD